MGSKWLFMFQKKIVMLFRLSQSELGQFNSEKILCSMQHRVNYISEVRPAAACPSCH